MRYDLYRPATSSCARNYAEDYDVPKSERDGAVDASMRDMCEQAVDDGGAALRGWFLVTSAETQAYMPHCITYFPSDVKLLEMLESAKMDIELDSIDISKLPRAFSIAWPVECGMPGVMVRVGREGGRRDDWKSYCSKYWPGGSCPNSYIGLSDGAYPDGSIRIDIFHRRVTEDDGEPGYGGLTLRPGAYSRELINEEASYVTMLERHCPGEADTALDHRTLRMILRLMVYITACPDAVKAGFPESKIHDVGTRYHKPTPMTIGFPDHCLAKAHASPEMHWRNMHFRSFPLRRDGTRQVGVVFVNGAVVCGHITPRTVVEVSA